MPFNTALFVIHEYEISCKISLFKINTLSSKIKYSRKDRLNLLADAVLEIIIVRCYIYLGIRGQLNLVFYWPSLFTIFKRKQHASVPACAISYSHILL